MCERIFSTEPFVGAKGGKPHKCALPETGLFVIYILYDIYIIKQNHVKLPVLLVKTGWILTISWSNLSHLLNGMTCCLRNKMENSPRYVMK